MLLLSASYLSGCKAIKEFGEGSIQLMFTIGMAVSMFAVIIIGINLIIRGLALIEADLSRLIIGLTTVLVLIGIFLLTPSLVIWTIDAIREVGGFDTSINLPGR